MKIEDIVKLMDEMNKHGMDAVTYSQGDEKISIRKSPKTTGTVATMPSIQSASKAPEATVATENTSEQITSGNIVKSPLVGTFYASSSPEAAAYVQVGDTVKKGQVLGIIEAMKLMNEVESDFGGVVKEILVKDKTMVEYGQPMFVIE